MAPKKTHSDHCSSICIACLKRTKPAFTRNLVLKNGDNSLENIVSSRLYSNFFQEKDYLPNVICVNCRTKLEDEKSEFEVLIDYKALSENVKEEQNKVQLTSNNGENCLCELCRLGSKIVNPNAKNKSIAFDSPFLLQRKSVSAASKGKLPKVTDFFTQSKDQTKNEKIQDIIQFTDTDSLAQLSAAFLEHQAKLLGKNELLVKRVHGPPIQMTVGGHKCPKTVISHETLFRIKRETNQSGNRIVQIGMILKDDEGVKIEPYFKEAVIERNHAVEEFFDDTLVDVYVYEKKDFQLWSVTEEGNLVDKVTLAELLNVKRATL